jgi:P-type E1-E2 ATPase
MKTNGDLNGQELLQLSASLDQASHHVVARALVAAAQDRDLVLEMPSHVREEPGSGVEGQVGGREVVVGGWEYVQSRSNGSPFAQELGSWIQQPGTISVAVAVDRVLAGALIFGDEVRPETAGVLQHLRTAGVMRVVLVTGDRGERGESVGTLLGVDAVISDMKPQDKVAAVLAERVNGPVMMVGDGVNDAPALAAADVGVAMGARGAAASSEAADVVILVDRLDRLVDAISIARRSRHIALQSVYVGIGLSVTGMIAAAFGYLTPVQGAVLQEAIDVAVIINALRALGGPDAVRIDTLPS